MTSKNGVRDLWNLYISLFYCEIYGNYWGSKDIIRNFFNLCWYFESYLYKKWIWSKHPLFFQSLSSIDLHWRIATWPHSQWLARDLMRFLGFVRFERFPGLMKTYRNVYDGIYEVIHSSMFSKFENGCPQMGKIYGLKNFS